MCHIITHGLSQRGHLGLVVMIMLYSFFVFRA